MDKQEEKCKDSLQKLTVSFKKYEAAMFYRIFSTFQQIRQFSFEIGDIDVLKDFPKMPILPCLEKLSFCENIGNHQNIIKFLKMYPNLKELRINNVFTSQKLSGQIVAALPNLRCLAFISGSSGFKIVRPKLMNLTGLKK